MITDLPTRAITVTNIYQIFTYKMAAKINWHRYRTKLRHCHSMHTRLLAWAHAVFVVLAVDNNNNNNNNYDKLGDCLSGGNSDRLSCRGETVMPRMCHHLQLTGWPYATLIQ